MAEILASLDDINANLPSADDSPVAIATDENTELLQISVARIIRGYLSRVIENSILLEWKVPDNTPDIIREVAGKLIASQFYFNQTAKTSIVIDPDSFAQHKYDEAMEILRQIVTGEVIIDGVDTNSTENLSVDDFFPRDSTDRAFTRGMVL